MREVVRMQMENACLLKSCFGLSNAELQFVLKYPGLNSKQKYVWLVLATLCTNDPEFASQMSLSAFAKMLRMSVASVSRVIKQLEIMGFVQFSYPLTGLYLINF